jgi:hypothetical protein
MWDDIYMICNNSLKYPKYLDTNLENYGKIKIGAISGSGMTDWQPTYNTATAFPWFNKLSDSTNIIGENSSYRVEKSSALKGELSLNLNVSSSLNVATAMELHYWPTGSTPGGAGSGYTTLATFGQYFDNYAAANTGGGGINLKETITTAFVTSKLDVGTYYFGLKYFTYAGSTGGLKVTIDPNGTTKSYLHINKAQQAADGRIMNIPLNMPYGENGIKLVDFVKGLQKKYNLVIYPNNTKQNEFIIEPFNNWYNKGELVDFDKYINLDEIIEVIPANNLAVNKLQFGDKLGNDYIALQFSKENTREYAKSYYTDTQNFFSQGDFNVETTFSVTPLTYLTGTGLSGSAEGINPGPPTSYGYYVGNAGYGSSYDACNNTSYFPYTLWAASPDIYDVGQLYQDISLTIPFDGGYAYWKLVPQAGSQYYSVFIQYGGYVYSAANCGYNPYNP